MRLHPLLALAVMATAIPCQSRQFTPSEALARIPAGPHTAASRTGAAPELRYTAVTGGINTVYVFSRGEGSGFLVVAADDVAPKALLGYSDSGSFDPATMPDNMSWWLEQYGAEIAMAASGSSPIKAAAESGPATDGRAEIEPIVKTRWAQLAPYNDLCPEVDGTRTPAGCVAIAMAQVMKVFNWPASGTGAVSYTPYSLGTQLSLDFDTITYQWDDMLDSYRGESTQAQKNAVATLIYSCGVAANMEYSPVSSGSNSHSAIRALIGNFNYDKSLRCLERDYFGIDEWTDMIYAELALGHPVIYGGRNDEGGHSFVCDGYRSDGYFHINWGWDGISDGYFQLTALNPEEQGTGGSSGGYNIGQEICLGLQPAREGSTYTPVFVFISSFATADTTVVRPYGQAKFIDRRGIFNQSVGEITASMGVKLTDESGNSTYASAPQKTYAAGQGFMEYIISAQEFPQSGTYTVTPAVRDENGVWHDALVKMGYQRDLRLVATPDSLVFYSTELPVITSTAPEPRTPLFIGKDCAVRATLKNVSGEEYFGTATPIFYSADMLFSQVTPVAVDILPDSSAVTIWMFEVPASLKAGDYTLYIMDNKGKIISPATNVKIEQAPREAAAAVITAMPRGAGGDGTESSPREVSLSDFSIDITAECTSGYISGYMNGGVYYDPTRGVQGMPGPFIGLKAGQSTTVNLTADLSELESDHVYLFYPELSGNGKSEPVYFRASQQNIESPVASPITVERIPGTGSVMVSAPEPLTGITLTGMNGMMLLDMKPDGPFCRIDLGEVPAGVYVLRIATLSETESVKIVL